VNVQRLNALLSTESPFEALKAPQPATPDQNTPNFSDVLTQALNAVEQDQTAVTDAAAKLASGQTKDVADVMIASERANLSLNLTVQVRNKLLEAYQEIMRMPL
jgi:flagellar hook-basal body complex protein FliE